MSIEIDTAHVTSVRLRGADWLQIHEGNDEGHRPMTPRRGFTFQPIGQEWVSVPEESLLAVKTHSEP